VKGSTGVTLSWTDPTAVPASMTAYDPISNTSGFLGNPNNEIGFRVERASVVAGAVQGPYLAVSTGLQTINAITQPVNVMANATTYLDSILAGVALTTPTAPVFVSQTATSVTLTLPALVEPLYATGYDVYRNGVLLAPSQPAGTFVDTTAALGARYSYAIMAVAGLNAPDGYSYRVVAVTAAGDTVSSNAISVDGMKPSNSALSVATPVLMAPTVPVGVTVTNPTIGSLQVNWSAAPASQAVNYYLVSTNGAAGVQIAASPDVVTGLSANSSYSFTVAAHNATGTSTATAPVTGLTLPAAPTALSIGTVGATSIALSWTAPTISAGLTYTVVGVPAGASVAYGGTSALVTGLGPNTSYSFTVMAHNASGASTASNAAAALTLPVAPTGLVATPASSSSVTLSWSASLNGARDYTVQYSANGGGTFTSLPSLIGLGMTVNSLTPSTSYLFQVVANNATGSSPPSSQVPATTPAATVIPGVPTCCSVTLATATSVTINWIAPATGPATSYNIQRATNGTFTRGLQSVLNVLGTSMPFAGLNSNTTYYFRVMAVNAVGSSAYSSTFSFQPPTAPATPAAPTAVVSALSTAAPTVTLTLQAPPAGVTYTVYQQSRTSGGAVWSTATVAATGISGTSWTSAALPGNLQYRYYLVAVNAAGTSGNSQRSNNVTARQLANAPVGPTATPVTTGMVTGTGTRSVMLTWALGADNGTTVTAVRLLRNTTGTLAAPTTGQSNGALTGGVTTTNVATNALSTTASGLARNTTYYFQVQEVTAGGSNQSVVVSATTAP
ncbi:MAG: fibronectin type III domain-containing protein, partial [Proteobacteria bacterium]|nr:fibronectin type III domain-containing protein [Pseudomonadota bacterium]